MDYSSIMYRWTRLPARDSTVGGPQKQSIRTVKMAYAPTNTISLVTAALAN